MRVIAKYLERYAEAEHRLIAHLPNTYAHALVLPSYAEGRDLADCLRAMPGDNAGDVLFIVVVNGRRNAPEAAHEANSQSLAALREYFGEPKRLSDTPPAALYRHPHGAVLCIERCADPWFFGDRDGVGLARKIGADIALHMRRLGRLRNPWIATTDVDATLPADYFKRSDAQPYAAALIFPFWHDAPAQAEHARAMNDYELHLRYYVAGLRFARSPYAFQSIGSTLAVGAEAYAQVRGFPKRRAGEDFYVLNKLAKVGDIVALGGEPIRLSPRLSERTPFGTGAALRKALDNETLVTYAPDVFRYLRAWIAFLNALKPHFSASQSEAALRITCTDCAVDAGILREIADNLGEFARIDRALKTRPDADALRRHLHTNFDALRTLRFIHALRDARFGSVSVSAALYGAEFIPHGVEDTRRALYTAEQNRIAGLARYGIP